MRVTFGLLVIISLTACPTPSSQMPCTRNADCPNSEFCATADGGHSCEAINAGSSTCNVSGFLCADRATALECKVGMWARLPCRGDGGCLNSMGTITCDMNGAIEGDACASSAEGRGLCTDGGTLECRDGRFVKTNTCRSCVVQNDTVVCTP
ncbi:MAG: hypothetical protein U0228_34530 [Myxococcaceae bacterium]